MSICREYVADFKNTCYTCNVIASYTWYGKGGSDMEIITSLIVAIVGGVACHYIIKWLDGDK